MGIGEYLITLLAQFGGGRGGPEKELVRFALAAVFWGTLLAVALKRRGGPAGPRERLLVWGFALGLFRELFMFGINSVVMLGVVPFESMHFIFPPLEHFLLLLSQMTVAAAFLSYVLEDRLLARRYLIAGASLAAALYLVTAFPWAQRLAATPELTFGKTWNDWGFHVLSAVFLLQAMLLLGLRKWWLTAPVMLAFGLFLLHDLMMMIQMAQGEVHKEVLGPIRNVLRMAAIPVLGYVYLREMDLERRQSTQRLVEALAETESERNKTAAVMRAIGDALSIQDVNMKILYQNQSHRELMGDHIGEICYRAYRSSEQVCKDCPVSSSFADGKIHTVSRSPEEHGVPRHLEIVASSVRDNSGKVVAGVELIRDITERKRAEEELRGAKEVLERQNEDLKMLDRIKDGLIRDVTHELKTPVAKQAMFLEILRGHLGPVKPGDETEKVIAVLESSIARQEKIISSILDLSRLEAGGRKFREETVYLTDLVRETMEDYRYAFEAHGFTLETDLEPLVILTDAQMLRSVISNLIDNAVKYRSRNQAPLLRVSVEVRGKEAVIRVRDNGVGMTPYQLLRAFDRFYQATATSGGIGVGLTIARMIVEGLGGKIRLESPGRDGGLTAEVSLPLPA